MSVWLYVDMPRYLLDRHIAQYIIVSCGAGASARAHTTVRENSNGNGMEQLMNVLRKQANTFEY